MVLRSNPPITLPAGAAHAPWEQGQAKNILNRLEACIQTLATLAMRGRLPEELTAFGNTKIREIQEFPWRIFYRPESDEVFVLIVLDGRMGSCCWIG